MDHSKNEEHHNDHDKSGDANKPDHDRHPEKPEKPDHDRHPEKPEKPDHDRHPPKVDPGKRYG